MICIVLVSRVIGMPLQMSASLHNYCFKCNESKWFGDPNAQDLQQLTHVLDPLVLKSKAEHVPEVSKGFKLPAPQPKTKRHIKTPPITCIADVADL